MPPRQSDNAILGTITASGLRCTRQRKALYAALRGTTTHPTADELYRRVSARLEGVSLATVYNTLEAFCAAGIAQKIPGVGQNGSARYDATTAPHMHVRCTRTGRVADVPEPLSERILNSIPPATLAELEKALGFSVGQVQIELLGEYTSRR